MDIFKIFAVSGSGMSAQKSRMSVVAGNLANAETTRTPEGGPYRRRNIVFETTPLEDPFSNLLRVGLLDDSDRVLGVEVAGVRESGRAPKKIYDPHHPDAGPEGYVLVPDINVMEEMVDLMSAVRSYEANLAAFNATKTLVRRLLEMGRQA